MPLEDHQLRAADHGKALDNQDRNAVREQTQEAYGDEALHAETKTVTMQHFPGQPLETVTDHEANEELRAEQYQRALVDPVYRSQMKIDIAEEDEDQAVPADGLALGTHTPLPDDVDPDPDLSREDAIADDGRTDLDTAQAAGSDAMHPPQPVAASQVLDEGDHAEPGQTPDQARAEQSDVDQEAVADAAPDADQQSDTRGGE